MGKSNLKIAVIMTVHNRRVKTIACLDSLQETHRVTSTNAEYEVFITDDGCTDGTVQAVEGRNYEFGMHIVAGDGSLFWNGGMIKAWEAAIEFSPDFDGFLWLNDDVILLPDFWNDIDSLYVSGRLAEGIYVGSTKDPYSGQLTYGGFDFVNRWTLADRFVEPDGKSLQPCQCAHGNITFVTKGVVDKMGIFYDGYVHGAGDHDYTYRAYKAGFPVCVLPHYAGLCANDHREDGYADFLKMKFSDRIAYLNSPFGFNLHNTLLFQKRCFPHRYAFVWVAGYLKAFFPNMYMKAYYILRRNHNNGNDES